MSEFWLITFWSSLIILVYVLGGYAVLLLALRPLGRRGPTAEIEPTVSLVIPAHNEEKVLAAKLENALSLDYPADRLEIVVASDGSSDRTIEIAGRFEPRGVRVLNFPERRGKASVMNDAVETASGEVLCLCDANVMFQPDALKKLVARLADPNVGAATGVVCLASHESNFGRGESFYYRLERAIQLAESEIGSLMGVDGGMYVLRKELFRPLPPDTILDDFVLSMRVLKAGKKVVYEPAAVAHESGTPKAMQEFRRRVRVSAGAVQSIKRGEFPPLRRPVLLWQFLSHKLLRWMGPLWLVLLLVSSAMLWHEGTLYRAAFLGQLAVYLAAGVGAVSVGFRGTRLGAVPFYFVMSHVAIVVGLVRGLLNRQKVTWAQADRRPAASQQEVSSPS